MWVFDRQYFNFLFSVDAHLSFFGSLRNPENLTDEGELLGGGHEVNGAREAFRNHLRVDMLDGLAEPRELQPYPLLIVVVADLFPVFVVILL